MSCSIMARCGIGKKRMHLLKDFNEEIITEKSTFGEAADASSSESFYWKCTYLYLLLAVINGL